MAKSSIQILDKGTLSFTIESRILRELGERLVKEPEVALLELIKNSYDADSTSCVIDCNTPKSISIEDNGCGMTFEQFAEGWMRIGTSSKENLRWSNNFSRLITGEKGIGRFSVRFLGKMLQLETVADDPKRKCRTRLIAEFDWEQFDINEDLGKVSAPYRIEKVDHSVQTGTKLQISKIRSEANRIDFKKIRTGSMGLLSPLQSLFAANDVGKKPSDKGQEEDPGFGLVIRQEESTDEDVGTKILESFVLRATLKLINDKLEIYIYRKGHEKPYIKVIDTYSNGIGKLSADIRFFPRREGTFRDSGVDGRVAQSWVSNNAGVAVFDRNFRVLPYGVAGDDWLSLAADKARNERDPKSSITLDHFPMSSNVKASTSLNWMLKLPQPTQIVGLVQVEGRRTSDKKGLVASADRQGFVDNNAFHELWDLVRGSIELIAYADKQSQIEEDKKRQAELLASIRKETKSAIAEIQKNPDIASDDKRKIVKIIAETQRLSEQQEEQSKQREQQLEVMSLLGVVAGFMTHEFGVAMTELEDAHKELIALARTQSKYKPFVEKFSEHIKNLREFVNYSRAYISNSKTVPTDRYSARPRLQQVKKIFGKYAEERNINVEINVEFDLMAPPVPAALYSGVALNLYTNALKAVTAKAGNEEGRIAFRAWNDEKWHYLEVSDNGIGVPAALHKRVFDPFFTTTESRNDPLGSGMGLGLALVKRCVEAFDGKAELVAAPSTFATCVQIKLPLEEKN